MPNYATEKWLREQITQLQTALKDADSVMRRMDGGQGVAVSEISRVLLANTTALVESAGAGARVVPPKPTATSKGDGQ